MIALMLKAGPIIYHAHNYPSLPKGLKDSARLAIEARLYDAIIAVSHDVGRAWSNATRTPVHIVPNGIDLTSVSSERRPISSASPVFGIATRFAYDKGIHELLQAALAIRTRCPGARFTIAGDGPERPSVERQVIAYGLERAVELRGWVKDVNAFWREMDIALFTAPREPFGLRILEPIANGVPVVGYLTGAGSDDILSLFPSSCTAKYGDPTELASKALALVQGPGAYSSVLKQMTRILEREFSCDRMTSKTIEIYNQLLDSSHF
jgi:glycosyltransferase involved in cell wall biosynthesis